MARIEFPPELHSKIEESGPVDLVVGITGVADAEELRAKASCLQGIAEKIVVAYPGVAETQSSLSPVEGLQFVAYPLPVETGSLAFWLDIAAAQENIVALASAWQARACFATNSDLKTFSAETARLLIEPVLQEKNDLIMGAYPGGKYDGLINKSLLAPLSRALYGRRVRWPLSFDFCAGANACAHLLDPGPATAQNVPNLLWPANAVAMNGGQIGQAALDIRHATPTDGLDLSAVLTDLAGSLFQEAETCAAHWQKVRGSQPVTYYGNSVIQEESAQPVDPRPMMESFVLGSLNLDEVWRLVLPPATMLELKRMTRLNVEQFRMPDALWARIVYDFALAHRMRRLSRSHLLGALTPIYLGWVASYTQEVGGVTAAEADQRVEQLARAYEEQKPYFVSRWRWPERVS